MAKAKQTEGQRLDALSHDEAKSILLHLGYFSDETYFLSLRLNGDELRHVQEALAYCNELGISEFISALCEQFVLDELERKK